MEEETFRSFYQVVPGERQEKIDSLKMQKDKCLSLGAGILLEKAMDDVGLEEEDRTITTGEYGKPSFLPHVPYFFNLSHSGTKVLCVFADRLVGCDVETIRDRSKGVAKRVFSKEENEDLEKASDKALAFTRLWCRRESYLKMKGTGFTGNEREVDYSRYFLHEGNDDQYAYAFLLDNQGEEVSLSSFTVDLSL